MPVPATVPSLSAVLEAGRRRSLRVDQRPERTVDLSPHELLWGGDPMALCFFGIKVPKGERGPWLRDGRPWKEFRTRFVKTEEIAWWLRSQWPSLERDAFATVNRFFWRSGEPPRRRAEAVVRLGATYVDCDCGREGQITAHEAEETLRELVERGVVPAPSLLQRSGRGLWGFWALEEEGEPGVSPLAFGAAGDLWRAIQRAGADRLVRHAPELAIDRAALDAARMTRLHGSLHSGTGRRVVWTPYEAEGPIRRYTLDELAAFYGVDRGTVGVGWDGEGRPAPPRDRALEEHRLRQEGDGERGLRRSGRVADRVAQEKGRKGHVALWRARRLEFLERVVEEELGGEIPQGRRHGLLLLYGYVWSKLGLDEDALRERLETLVATRCEAADGDRVSGRQISELVGQIRRWRESKGGGLIRNVRFAELAGFDPVLDRARIEELGLTLERDRPKGRKELTARRREVGFSMLAACAEAGEPLPSVRELAGALTAEGVPTGRDTASRLLWAFRGGN